MRELSLEWSSRAGPATLALLAGPWRRNDSATATHELFRVHVPADAVAAPIAATALPAPGIAARRLLAILRDRSEARRPELLRMLADPDATSGSLDEVTRELLELAGRATAPASVETRHGDRLVAITDISAAGSLVARVAADIPTAVATLHAQSVAAALATRAALLRVTLETTQLAALIAGVVDGAGTPALPLAWRFLHDLLAEHAASPDGD